MIFYLYLDGRPGADGRQTCEKNRLLILITIAVAAIYFNKEAISLTFPFARSSDDSLLLRAVAPQSADESKSLLGQSV